MALLNIVSLSKHIDEIRLLLENQTVDILALNETRLHPDIPSEFVNIDEYDIVRMDRDKHSGGVCFYIRRTISYLNRGDLVPENLESVCLEINQPNSRSFIVSTIYRPPSATVEPFSQIESLLNLLDQSNSSAKHLHSIMQLYQLTQVMDKPTRITESSSTLLDVCITSCPERIAFHDVIHMGVSDHSLIYVVRKINSYLKPHASKKVEFRSFKHFNVENFKVDLINLPWYLVDRETDIDNKWACWKNLFMTVLDDRGLTPPKVAGNQFLLPPSRC